MSDGFSPRRRRFRSRLDGVLLALAVSWVATGCARPATPPRAPNPQVEAERHRQYEEAASRLLEYMERVSRVGSRVTVAAAPFCGDEVKPYVGILTASSSSIARRLGRHQAWIDAGIALREAWQLDGTPEVLAVLPDSPAERAGILPGDHVIALDIVEREDRTPLSIEVERGRRTFREILAWVPECAYDVSVTIGDLVNAHLDGETVLITSGLLRFVESDDELAFVIGHELAHRMLGHRRSAVRSHERAADYLAVYVAARAGYEPAAALPFVRRLAAEHPELISDRASPAHPGTAERVAALQLAIREIGERRRDGAPLVPGPLDGL